MENSRARAWVTVVLGRLRKVAIKDSVAIAPGLKDLTATVPDRVLQGSMEPKGEIVVRRTSGPWAPA